jgi:hypothetical protein
VIKAVIVVASGFLLAGFSGHRQPITPSATAAATATATASDTSASFSWTGSIPSGSWLRVRNIAGSIEVTRSPGNSIEIHASPEPGHDSWWDRGRIEPVKFVVQRQGTGVTVCAISASIPHCDPDNLSSSENGWNDVHPQPMHVVVRLPAGLSLQAGTMHGDLQIASVGGNVLARSGHGDITIQNAGGTVDAESGHGDVDIVNSAMQVTANTGHGNVHVSADGAVQATTGHGDVDVELASSAGTGTGDMKFETGHGSVSVIAPRSLNGEVDMHTGRGRVSSDFPLGLAGQDRYSRSDSAHGTLGSGGREIRLSSGHGDVSLNTRS